MNASEMKPAQYPMRKKQPELNTVVTFCGLRSVFTAASPRFLALPPFISKTKFHGFPRKSGDPTAPTLERKYCHITFTEWQLRNHCFESIVVNISTKLKTVCGNRNRIQRTKVAIDTRITSTDMSKCNKPSAHAQDGPT